jgi:hypothetical protein
MALSPRARSLLANEIKAVHARDGLAARVLIEHCDKPRTLRALAMVADGLICDLAEWNRLEPADALARLREWGAGNE